jgi:hypothetical protein
MDHKIEWYIGLMNELDMEFDPVTELFEAIDDMVRPTWSLPSSFTEVVKDVMAVVDTAPSDAINSAAISFAGSDPIINCSPFAANVAEYDRAQTLEDTLFWHFSRDNKRGNGTLMQDIAESILKYNTICVRTDDLAYILPKNQSKWTPLQRRAWQTGRFIHKAVHPANVRYIMSDMGLTLVGHTETFKVQDVLKHWELYENNDSDEGRMIAATLKDLREAVDQAMKTTENSQGIPQRDIYFTQTYCIDDDKLMTWGRLTNLNGEDLLTQPTPDYVFADQKNPYGFIPWAIRVAGSRIEQRIEYRVNPLLAPLYWSGSWDKLNLAKSIIFSEPIRRARSPRVATMTQSGEPPTIDYANGNDIALRVGEQVTGLQPLTLDNGAMAIIGALESAMNRTTGASMIGDTTKMSSNTPFSTYSAMIKVALSRLGKQKDFMGVACQDVVCNMLWWVDKTDVPLTAYAESNKQYRSGTMLAMGQKTEISKNDYDLNSLGITVKIHPASVTDEMEQLNKAVILSTKLNYPASQALQDMGYSNIGLMYELWQREFLKNAELQAKAQGMIVEATTAAQMAAQQQQQQQAQAQQQPQPGGQPGEQPQGAGQGMSNTSFGMLGGQGQGVNPAMGGMAPAQAAPSMTREQLMGQTANQGR